MLPKQPIDARPSQIVAVNAEVGKDLASGIGKINGPRFTPCHNHWESYGFVLALSLQIWPAGRSLVWSGFQTNRQTHARS